MIILQIGGSVAHSSGPPGIVTPSPSGNFVADALTAAMSLLGQEITRAGNGPFAQATGCTNSARDLWAGADPGARAELR